MLVQQHCPWAVHIQDAYVHDPMHCLCGWSDGNEDGEDSVKAPCEDSRCKNSHSYAEPLPTINVWFCS